MKLFFSVKIMPHLLQEEISIKSFCEVFDDKIVSTGFFKKDFEIFKAKFFSKYELEYGVNKHNFIVNEFEKYVRLLEKSLEAISNESLKKFLRTKH